MLQRPPAIPLMRNFGLEPDSWQVQVLQTDHKQILLNCARQAGKSTVVAVLALAEALFVPFTKILLLSRSYRQSAELFRVVTDLYARMEKPMKIRLNAEELLLSNHSRIICLPCKEETIRGYSDIGLLIIDEAARVPDDLYRAVRPMLATSGGRLICLSTPYGKRGFFFQCWAFGGDDWLRIQVPATKIPRITPTFLAQERRALGDSWFRQEYACSFEALEGLVYPDFANAIIALLPPELEAADAALRAWADPSAPFSRPPATGLKAKLLGGIDFGFRNPFAAVWGILDNDILYLTGEHYSREKPLSFHAARLPRNATWYADPAGAGEISELKCANFTITKGNNTLRPGIAAVRARLENRTLRVLHGRCPNLLAEAGLYRYGSAEEGKGTETPIDEHNHALAALRYLIARLDTRWMARLRKALHPDSTVTPPDPPAPPPAAPRPLFPGKKKWLRYDNEALWTRLF